MVRSYAKVAGVFVSNVEVTLELSWLGRRRSRGDMISSQPGKKTTESIEVLRAEAFSDDSEAL